jgi:hypothetical protein
LKRDAKTNAARSAWRHGPRWSDETRDVARLVMPEQRQQNDDRQRNAEQPQQQTSSKAHWFLRLVFANQTATAT